MSIFGKIACAVVVAVIASGSARAAVCQDYTNAIREDRSLFDGFILGFVSAKLEDRGGDVNATTLKVKRMVGAYCLQRPQDSIAGVVATFTAVVIHVNQ